MDYKASCHCGNVQIEFSGEFGPAIACNCSICARRGSLLTTVPTQPFDGKSR